MKSKKNKKKCPFAHTKWQPKEEDFICPDCGNYLFQLELIDGINCTKLHKKDQYICDGCERVFTGEEYDKIYWATK